MSTTASWKALLAFSASALCLAPGPVLAQTSSTAQLEERIRSLEAALAEVRTELGAVRAAEHGMRDDIVRLRDAPAAAPVQAAAPARDGFQVGATTFRIGGFIKADALFTDYSAGDAPAGTSRDLYQPGATPVGGASEDDLSVDFHGKQTRLSLTATRAVEGHTLSGYLEGDFQTAPGTQGSEMTTNGYNFAMRRAYISYDKFLFGQDWSTFQNSGVLPETTDFVGPTEGTVFVRQAQIRYSQPLGEGLLLQVALENPETGVSGIGAVDDDTMPDVVGRLNLTRGSNQFSLAGVVRQLNYEQGAVNAEETGFGLSAAGKIVFDPRNDLRFMVSGGEGIGRYLGLGFAPDAVLVAGDLQAPSVLSGFVSLRHGWSPRTRSTVSYSMIEVDRDGLPATASESSWSASANLFFEPTSGLLLGAEYRYAERELFNGLDGALSRLHLVAKQNF